VQQVARIESARGPRFATFTARVGLLDRLQPKGAIE
jgi:hypothetical protein